MLKHHSVMVDILDKFEVLEKRQKKDVAKKLIDSGMYIPK
jgi:glycine cleavage system protein P-like pyridoxal-binding family